MRDDPLDRAHETIRSVLGVRAWRVIKRDRDSLVGAGQWPGGPASDGFPRGVVVKFQALRGLGGTLRTLLGLTRADRQARGAARLRDAGVPTAAVYTLLVERDGPARGTYLVLERLAGRTLLEHLAAGDDTPRTQHALAHAAGAMIAALLARGLMNADGKPSNLIVTALPEPGRHAALAPTPPAPPGAGPLASGPIATGPVATGPLATGVVLAVIDAVGIRRRPVRGPAGVAGSGERARARMLRDLILEPLGCGLRPRRALMMRTLLAALDRPDAWPRIAGAPTPPMQTPEPADRRALARARARLWRDVAARVHRHGDPTPRVDPLAPPPGSPPAPPGALESGPGRGDQEG